MLLLAARPAAADLGGFTIRSFHSDLVVEPNGDLIVDERIAVLFHEPRHGIYRTIPVSYTDPRGFAYGLRFKLLDVTDGAGAEHKTVVRRKGRNVEIRIGDPDWQVEGDVIYVIRYRVQGAIAHHDTHDELYWNAIGDAWATTIDQSSATVVLPGEIAEDEVQVQAYAGPYGSSAETVDTTVNDLGRVEFNNTRPLRAFEGMTIVVGWRHGLVDFPSPAMVWIQRLLRNWVLVLPLVTLAWIGRRYRRFGRDPEVGGSIPVRYEPPAGVGPGEIGTLVDESVDMRDITATVVDLAVRGFMRIEVEERRRFFVTTETTTFARLATAGDERLQKLLPHERLVFDGIFSHGDNVEVDDLKESFYKELPGIKSALYGHLAEEGYFVANPDSVRTKYGVFAFGLAVAVLGIGVANAYIIGGVFPTALIVPIVAATLTAIVVVPFVGAMPRRTEQGVRMREWAKGFEEFVDRVESDRLERSAAVTAFETLLPYAMALGVAATWAKKFEGIYEAGREPTWYVGPHYAGTFSTSSLEKNVSSSMAAAATSMAAAPRSSSSSGFGGGGSVGGGFGGGGGGSW